MYLAFNDITDLSPCSMLEHLTCLDLEGNLIDDLQQVEFLTLCTKLANLTLYGNPICAKTYDRDSAYSYRHATLKLLPALSVLDDEPALSAPPLRSAGDRGSATGLGVAECPFDDDWQLIGQFVEEGIGPCEEKLAISGKALFLVYVALCEFVFDSGIDDSLF